MYKILLILQIYFMNARVMVYGLVFLLAITVVFGFIKFGQSKPKTTKIKGITMVAPPKKFMGDPMPEIKKINADWVALVPYAYTPQNKAEVHFGIHSWQWWGEKVDGIEECILLAKKNGLKILLKPQVYIHGSWTGDLQFQSSEDWELWESQYEKYIMTFAEIAAKHQLEMFCIGTEFVKSSELRPEFWIKLIEKIRSFYKGMLTYSDNWDHYSKITFWQHLDVIGISAYFPIAEGMNPDSNTLLEGWKKWKTGLHNFSQKLNKNILFTEYGYLSVDGSAGKSWELEKGIENRFVNQQAQADAFQALYSALYHEEWWSGGFIWKWFPEGMGHEGYPERDYTPQSKKAEKIISHWYSKN